ncbi:MAG: TlpA disulfide reductase family protein [Bacteroidota bacterium]
MKKAKPLLFLISVFFISCSQDKVDVINEMIHQLNQIETVKYEAIFMGIENNDLELWNETSTVYFDLRGSVEPDLRYYLLYEDGKQIYNGEESITVHDVNNQVIISSPEEISPYNAISFSLLSLKKVLPMLLDNEEVYLSEQSDTIIDGRIGQNVKFFIENSYIDWENLTLSKEFGKEEISSWELSVTIDKNSHLPLLITQNREGSNQTWIYKIANVDFNYIETDTELWDKSTYSEGYVMYTLDEYMKIGSDKLASLVGKHIPEQSLSTLINDLDVDTSKSDGNMVLLEFWFKGCGACKLAIPSFNSIYEKYRNHDFAMYGVEFVERYPKDVLEAYIVENGKKYPNLFRGKSLANELGITGAPTILILNKKGKIIYANTGFDQGKVSAIIEEYL